MSITVNHDKSITISTIHKGYRRHQQYFGYTKREAVKQFRQWLQNQ